MSKLKAINGRVATKSDFEAGNAVFFVPDNRSSPYSLGRELPISARVVERTNQKSFWPAGTRVEILQAELASGNVLLGVVSGERKGVCTLKELELMEPSVGEDAL